MMDSIGWLATAVFSTSYFIRRRPAMLRVQSLAACIWLAYGLAIGSSPVIFANVIVATTALWSSFRSR